jgi:hypothetical protein
MPLLPTFTVRRFYSFFSLLNRTRNMDDSLKVYKLIVNIPKPDDRVTLNKGGYRLRVSDIPTSQDSFFETTKAWHDIESPTRQFCCCTSRSYTIVLTDVSQWEMRGLI